MGNRSGYQQQQNLSTARILVEAPTFVAILVSAILSQNVLVYIDLFDSYARMNDKLFHPNFLTELPHSNCDNFLAVCILHMQPEFLLPHIAQLALLVNWNTEKKRVTSKFSSNSLQDMYR